MKRFVALLGGLLILPAFAEVAPIYVDETAEYTQDVADQDIATDISDSTTQDTTTDDTIVNKPVPSPSVKAISPRNTTNSRNASASRIIPSSNTVTQRTSVIRPVSNRSATVSNVTSRNSNNENVVSRSVKPGTSTTSRRGNVGIVNTARAGSITQTDTVNTPIYTGRVGVRTSSASGIRTATTRVATTATAESAADSVDTMNNMTQMTDYCKAQYTQCMDNFCNVLDDNQGRCSCSKNIKNYAKTEAGLKAATADLQDVAQKIQYIGLSKDDVESLFTQTEAEETMQGKTDNSQLKNDLDKVKSLIFDVKTGSSSTASSSDAFDLSSLMDFSSDGSGFDLSAFFGDGSSNSSISNQRGETLYKTAIARCKTSVLTTCAAQGVDTAVLTNTYDLEIDKQCIAYERNLTDANSQMEKTVRNAKSVLQKARLMVAQQKNSYDLKSCITELDTCMQDDFVCGDGYTDCLDPTGKYIVNGKIVAGSTPGLPGGDLTSTDGATASSGIYDAWDYSTYNTWANGTVDGFIAAYIGNPTATSTTTNMVDYLEQKIGYNADGKDFGLCVSVLNKCQDVTYDNGEYQANNKVIDSYLQRTLMQIKAKQDTILSDYAENCVSEVSSCLSTNGYSDTAANVVNAAAKKACGSLIKTCSSVTGNSEDNVVSSAMDGSSSTVYTIKYLQVNGTTPIVWKTDQEPAFYYDAKVGIILPSASQIATSGCGANPDYEWELKEAGYEGYSAGISGSPAAFSPAAIKGLKTDFNVSGNLTFVISCSG